MMSNKWEKFAQRDARYYIDTTHNGKDEAFFNSGKSFVKESLKDVLPLLSNTNRALEIGCGIGRLTFPHAEIFDEVVAVDISPTMLDTLRKNASNFGFNNITAIPPEGLWDGDPIDYAYSYLVFQHIEDFDKIKGYIKRIASCLKYDKGYAQIQFDTRLENLAYRLRNKLPDWILPQNHQKGIRRIRRNLEELEEVFLLNQLEIIQQKNVGTARHTYLLRRTSDS